MGVIGGIAYVAHEQLNRVSLPRDEAQIAARLRADATFSDTPLAATSPEYVAADEYVARLHADLVSKNTAGCVLQFDAEAFLATMEKTGVMNSVSRRERKQLALTLPNQLMQGLVSSNAWKLRKLGRCFASADGSRLAVLVFCEDARATRKTRCKVASSQFAGMESRSPRGSSRVSSELRFSIMRTGTREVTVPVLGFEVRVGVRVVSCDRVVERNLRCH